MTDRYHLFLSLDQCPECRGDKMVGTGYWIVSPSYREDGHYDSGYEQCIPCSTCDMHGYIAYEPDEDMPDIDVPISAYESDPEARHG